MLLVLLLIVIVGGLRSVLSWGLRLCLTSASSVLDAREEEALVLWRESVERLADDE
jgi:hypothetical protein